MVVQGSCKVSAAADAPTTVLRTVPRPSQGGLFVGEIHCVPPTPSLGVRVGQMRESGNF